MPASHTTSRAGCALVEALVAVVLAALAALPVVSLVAHAVPAAHDAARVRRLARAQANVHAQLAAESCRGAPGSGGMSSHDGAITWEAARRGVERRSQVTVRSVRGDVRWTDRSVACE